MNTLPSRSLPTAFLCLALALLGLAGTLYKVHFPPGPVADEAAYLMMAGSLWHDHDLTYDQRDLSRAYRTWDQGPYGLILFTDDGGETMHYGKPYVYSLAALPFYAVFGAQGLVIFNMALYLAMLLVAWWFYRSESGFVALFLGGFFFASVSFNYVFWMQPEVFNMACIFFSLAAWHFVRRRESWGRREFLLIAGAALLLAAVFVSKEPLAVFAAPIGIDLLWSRRWKGAVAAIVAGVIGLALLVGVQHKLTDHWSPYREVQRRSFETKYPLEVVDEDPWALYKGTRFGSWSGFRIDADPVLLAKNIKFFLVGRHTGLLPYFPFALFALGLYLVGPKDRSRHLLLAAIAAYCLALFVISPHNYHGGAGFLGNRYFASVYPALLFLPGAFRARRSLALPFAAAGLWTLGVVMVPIQQVAPEFGLQVHTRARTFQALPLELTLLPGGRLPGHTTRNWGQGVWIMPRQNVFTHENHPNGVWVRGSSESEIWVASPVPLETVSFRAFSPLPENVLTVRSSEEKVVIPFSEEANRVGAPVTLAVEPEGRNFDYFGKDSREFFYRIELETTDGWMPARRDRGSQDYRYLSVFLSFTGKPP